MQGRPMNTRRLPRRCWLGLAASATLLLGACGGGGSSSSGGGSPPPDTTPNAFTFNPQGSAPLDTDVISAAVTISGINAAAPVSVTGGQYSIGAGAFTSANGTINNGDSIRLLVRSSAQHGTATSAMLTIGGVSGTFTVTTFFELSGEAPPVGSQNWPMFGRGYAQQRRANDPVISPDNIATLSVVHRVARSGVSGTPAVVDGVVYYGDYAGWLSAVNAESGAEIWRQRLTSAGGSMLTPSAFVTADAVYISGDAGYSPTGAPGTGAHVWARDRHTGAALWSKQIDATPFSRAWSSPVVVDDIVIVGVGSYQVWFPPTPPNPWFRGSVVGLNKNTGEEVWRFYTCPVDSPHGACEAGVSVWSSVAVDADLGLAYIGTGQAYRAPAGPYSDTLLALNYTTGALVWHYQFTPNDVYGAPSFPQTLDRDIGAAPNLFEAEIEGTMRQLVGVGDKGGSYKAFDRATGELIWERVLDSRTPPGGTIGGIMGTAAFGEGRIYLTNNNSVVADQGVNAYPGTSTAWALDAATGATVWSTNLDAGSFGGNTYANGLMLFSTWNGRLRALRAATGEQLHSVPLGTAIGVPPASSTSGEGFINGSTSGPTVANGRIYAGYGWTWDADVAGGLAILETAAEPPPWQWTPTCPSGVNPIISGLNTGFPTAAGTRDFHILPATDGSSGPRPVFVSLTGTVEPEMNFLRDSELEHLPEQGWTVIVPIRNCITRGHSCAGTPISGDGRTWEPWFDGAAAGNVQFHTDEGPDVRFIVDAVKCAATVFPIDQSRIFIGGISAGGTLANRALTFRSDFFAGGVPASPEWYRVDLGGGTTINTPVGNEIIEGRCCPRPLRDLHHGINMVFWGGPSDVWPLPPATPLANYAPSTKLSSNYYASQPNVVSLACSHNEGHWWPRNAAFTNWVAETLRSHPKGTPRESFVLPPPPPGFSCVVGSYTDH